MFKVEIANNQKATTQMHLSVWYLRLEIAKHSLKTVFQHIWSTDQLNTACCRSFCLLHKAVFSSLLLGQMWPWKITSARKKHKFLQLMPFVFIAIAINKLDLLAMTDLRQYHSQLMNICAFRGLRRSVQLYKSTLKSEIWNIWSGINCSKNCEKPKG